ncbi:hypothetical protein [Mucilaginibacter sp.]
MAIEPENQEKNETDQQNNEELAKQIPTVTPDEDNLEPTQEKEDN